MPNETYCFFPAGKSGISSSTIIAIVAPIAVTAVLFILGFCFLRRKAKKKYNAVPESNGKHESFFVTKSNSLLTRVCMHTIVVTFFLRLN